MVGVAGSFFEIDADLVRCLRGRPYASANELIDRLLASMDELWLDQRTGQQQPTDGGSHSTDSDRMPQTQSFITAVLAELGALPRGFTVMSARHLVGALIDMTQGRLRKAGNANPSLEGPDSANRSLTTIWLTALELNRDCF